MRLRSLTFGLALVAVSACGGDSGTEPAKVSVVGTWNLQTVNGQPLPFVIVQVGADKYELTKDSFTFSQSNTFTQSTTFRTTESGQVSTEEIPDAGQYTLNGTAVTLHFNSDGSSATGAVSGNTITVTDEGIVGVYRKQ